MALRTGIELGPRKAKELLWTADSWSASEAHRLGMVNHVVPRAELRDRAFALADLVAENSPAAIATTKQALWESLDVGLGEALAIGQRAIASHRGHPDGREGALAFREKRKPRWQGLILE